MCEKAGYWGTIVEKEINFVEREMKTFLLYVLAVFLTIELHRHMENLKYRKESVHNFIFLKSQGSYED